MVVIRILELILEYDLEASLDCVDVVLRKQVCYLAVVNLRVGVTQAGYHPAVDVIVEGEVGVVGDTSPNLSL